MKFTKTELKRIIKEELNAIICEKEESRSQKLFKQIFSDLRGMGKSKDEAFEKAREMVSNAPKGAAAPGLKFENEDAPIDLYSDYDEDPVRALEKRRAELEGQIVGSNPEAMDAFNEWKHLGAELAKLRTNLQESEEDLV